jgi:hypothetical protein
LIYGLQILELENQSLREAINEESFLIKNGEEKLKTVMKEN